jgi:2,3-bisphosphoglycerate-independent phosphoglycerate mutase
MIKVLFVILDGLGDRTAPELGHQTPLQFASTPNLDELAAGGMNGLMYSLSPGIAPATELAHFALFGYPLSSFPGRAVFEAVGEGLELNFEDVVLRGSFASVEDFGRSVMVVDRVFDADEDDLVNLAQEIKRSRFEEIDFDFIYNSKRQGILFLREDASQDITDSDPFANNQPVMRVRAFEETKEPKKAARTAEAVNQFLRWAHETLSHHSINDERATKNLRPINFLVTRWAGLRRKLPSFYEMYGFRGSMVASGPMLKGLASQIGLDFLPAQDREQVSEDLIGRLKMAQDALSSEYDFVHLHIKAADQAAHKKDPLLKSKVIEELDSAFATLVSQNFIADDLLIVMTSDHSTPSSGSLIHSGEPVPVLFSGKTVRRDGVCQFDEIACLDGGLGQISGKDLMLLILNFSDRIKYFGSRLTAKNVPYYPVATDFFEESV